MADPYTYEAMSSSRSSSGQHQPPHHQTLHRASSRQFDSYGSQPGLYTAEDHAARYDPTRSYDTTRISSATLGGYNGYEASGAQTWNPSSYGGAGTMTAMGGTGRIKAPSRQRSALPQVCDSPFDKITGLKLLWQGWMDPSPSLPTVSPLAGMGSLPMGGSTMRSDLGSDPGMGEEELIPTAIVIKNIPFAVKKEQLVGLMTEMNLPLPYAFNYHFDNGVFRGLAFANFTTSEETGVVIELLNGYELQGRKLRVEYKKMLPLQERERIEREKRERRGQLEEQHRPQQPPIPSTSPSPQSQRAKPGTLCCSPRMDRCHWAGPLSNTH